MINEIKKSWGWTGLNPIELVDVNNFGNMIIKSSNGKYWRINPEDVSCEVIANSKSEMSQLYLNRDFNEDWLMEGLVEIAENKSFSLEANGGFL